MESKMLEISNRGALPLPAEEAFFGGLHWTRHETGTLVINEQQVNSHPSLWYLRRMNRRLASS